jgi:hypothetical protein
MKKQKLITDKDIKEFIKQAELLRSSRYLETSSKSKVNITYTQGEGVKFLADMPTRDDIEVVLIRIRPFIEYNERLHVGRIITFLLNQHGESEFLKAYQSLFQPESELQYPAITLNEKEYRMRDLLILYMYGKYLHLDVEKQEISKAFESALGPLAEYFALSQIDKYIGIILGVAGYIRKNKLQESSGL